MPPYLRPIPSLLILFCSYVVWKWVGWFRSKEKVTPQWRRFAVLAGLCPATVSTGLSAFLFIHTSFTGGYPFYHPVEPFCLRIGSLTALLGFLAALLGKGMTRLPVAAISILNLVLWLVDAVAQ
jgi:hypothetical protein